MGDPELSDDEVEDRIRALEAELPDDRRFAVLNAQLAAAPLARAASGGPRDYAVPDDDDDEFDDDRPLHPWRRWVIGAIAVVVILAVGATAAGVGAALLTR